VYADKLNLNDNKLVEKLLINPILFDVDKSNPRIKSEFDSSSLVNKSFFDYRNNYKPCIRDMNNQNRSSFSTNSQSSISIEVDSEDERILLNPEFQKEIENVQNKTECYRIENLNKQKHIPYKTNEEVSYIINEVNVSENMTAFIEKCKLAISELEENIFCNRIDNNQFSDKIEEIQTLVKEFNIMFYENWISELNKLELYSDIFDDMIETFKNLKGLQYDTGENEELGK
ncbi:14709_t:CDS:2, partial [Racocetra persica]